MKPRKVYTPGCQPVRKGGEVDMAKDWQTKISLMVFFVRKDNYKTKYTADQPSKMVCQCEKQKDSWRWPHINYIDIEMLRLAGMNKLTFHLSSVVFSLHVSKQV